MKSERVRQLKALYTECFSDSLEFTDYYFSTRFDGDNCFFEEADGAPVSMALAVKKDAELSGKPVKAAYLSGVCTAAAFRGKGYAARTIGRALRFMQAEGVTLVLLSPSNGEFYKKFGFCDAVFGVPRAVHFSLGDSLGAVSHGVVLHLLEKNTALARAEEFLQCFLKAREGAVLAQCRDAEAMREKLRETFADGGSAYLVLSDKKPVGYVLTDLHGVDEFLLLPPLGQDYLDAFFELDGMEYTAITHTPTRTPLLQLRTVNVSLLLNGCPQVSQAALKAYGTKFLLADPILPSNNGLYTFETGEWSRSEKAEKFAVTDICAFNDLAAKTMSVFFADKY